MFVVIVPCNNYSMFASIVFVMQSPSREEVIVCGTMDRACHYVLYNIDTPGRGKFMCITLIYLSLSEYVSLIWQ